MRRLFLLLSLVVPFFFSCSGQSEDKRLEAFNNDAQSLFDSFNSQYQKTVSDTSLTIESKHAILDSLYGEIVDTQLRDLCLKTIKDNANNSVGVAALKVLYRNVEMTPQQMKELINTLGSKAGNDETVKQISSTIEATLSTSEGSMFKDFEVDGVKLSNFVGKGKYVLVDFWASWCGPCKEEIPTIAKVYEKYAGADFDVLSVAVWDKPEDTKKAAGELGIVWNQIINAQKVASDTYGFNSIPQIMLFGPDGTLLKRNLRGEEIEKAVKEALGR
ncbi:MAG TPA: hypothetical protein DHU75_08415 [Rikenellaceae bacterium]|nr:hypothetical protein [Rikenellaceae bacterium]